MPNPAAPAVASDAIDIVKGSPPVSAPGTMRLANIAGAINISVDGGAYTPFAGMGADTFLQALVAATPTDAVELLTTITAGAGKWLIRALTGGVLTDSLSITAAQLLVPTGGVAFFGDTTLGVKRLSAGLLSLFANGVDVLTACTTNVNTGISVGTRFQTKNAGPVAVAGDNSITMGDGNYCHLTGVVDLGYIRAAQWGSSVGDAPQLILYNESARNLIHNGGAIPGGFFSVKTKSGANTAYAAGTTIKLILDLSFSPTTAWVEL